MSKPLLKFVILINQGPYSQQAADSALGFSRALIRKGHSIIQVFFYHDGVYLGTEHAVPEQVERKITAEWANFASSQQIDLAICSNSALKRGIIDQSYANQSNLKTTNLYQHFRLVGLGQFVDASAKSDRVVSFGV